MFYVYNNGICGQNVGEHNYSNVILSMILDISGSSHHASGSYWWILTIDFKSASTFILSLHKTAAKCVRILLYLVWNQFTTRDAILRTTINKKLLSSKFGMCLA